LQNAPGPCDSPSVPYKRTLDEAVVRQIFAFAGRGEQDKIADLLHPDAIVVPTHHPEQVLRAEDYPAYAREQIAESPMREATASAVHALGEGMFAVEGRIRWSMPMGGFSDSGAAWALVIRDGLAFRMKGAASLSEARALRSQGGGVPRASRG
jgi:hypothetical protein